LASVEPPVPIKETDTIKNRLQPFYIENINIIHYYFNTLMFQFCAVYLATSPQTLLFETTGNIIKNKRKLIKFNVKFYLFFEYISYILIIQLNNELVKLIKAKSQLR
jgi:hypothetical protein